MEFLNIHYFLYYFQSCKYALRLLGPLLGSDSVSSMFQKHLLEDAHLHYGEFINDLAKAIVSPVIINSLTSERQHELLYVHL